MGPRAGLDWRKISSPRGFLLSPRLLILQYTNYEAYSDSKYRFSVKISNKVSYKFYCYQILHSSNYFSTYPPPLLRHLP